MKITKLLLIGLAVVFFSCGEDEDPKPTIEGMKGAWTVTGIDYKGTTTTTIQGIEAKSDFTGKGKDMDLTINFNTDPATFTSEGSYVIALTTTVAGHSDTSDYPFEGFLTDGTWKLEGSTITVTGAAGSQKATVIEQTATTLKLKWDFSYDLSQQGASVVMKVQGTYTFTKK